MSLMAVKKPPAPPPVKLPTEVIGLTGWYRGDGPLFKETAATEGQEATQTGDAVARWNDRSGNGRHAIQSTTASRPWLQLNQVNSLPALRFDGADDHLVTTNLSTFITTAAYCVYCVWRVTAVNTDSASIWINDAPWADNTGYVGQHLRTTGSLLYAYNWDGGMDSVSLPYALNTWYATRQRHVGGVLYLQRSGGGTEVSVPTAGSNPVLDVPLQLGKAAGSSNFAGEIAEFFAYNEDPAVSDRAALNQYLTNRYSLIW